MREIVKSDKLEIERILHLKFRKQETSKWTNRGNGMSNLRFPVF